MAEKTSMDGLPLGAPFEAAKDDFEGWNGEMSFVNISYFQLFFAHFFTLLCVCVLFFFCSAGNDADLFSVIDSLESKNKRKTLAESRSPDDEARIALENAEALLHLDKRPMLAHAAVAVSAAAGGQESGSDVGATPLALPIALCAPAVNPEVMRYPREIIDAFNAGDWKKLDAVITKLCTPECTLIYRYCGLGVGVYDDKEFVGSSSVSNFWKGVSESMPDGIFRIEETKFRKIEKTRQLVSKYNFSGTNFGMTSRRIFGPNRGEVVPKEPQPTTIEPVSAIGTFFIFLSKDDKIYKMDLAYNLTTTSS